MAALRQLIDPDDYVACDWDLKRDAAGRAYWARQFRAHVDSLIEGLVESYPDADEARIAALRAAYEAAFARVAGEPERFARLDILVLDQLRDDLLASFGFPDPFAARKRAENAAALALLPEVLAELDAVEGRAGRGDERLERMARGLMAGNVWDTGSPAAMRRHEASGRDFRRLRSQQPPRPWWWDDFEAFAEALRADRCRVVAIFVDNAGSDLVLGVLPWVRWLLASGRRVRLAANSGPALNDVTAAELAGLLGECCEDVLQQGLARGGLRVVATGTSAPLIDLTALSAECVEALSEAELVWLHGMGRAVESNWLARMRCAVLRTAVIKDEGVAAHVGARLFDCVWRWTGPG